MSSKIGVLVISIVLFLSLNTVGVEQEDGILFLTLQITSDQVSLIDSRTTSGKLKTPRTESGEFEINYEAVSKSGNIVLANGLDDPRFETLEYEDPDNPGQLKQIDVTRDTANFVIRVNSTKELSHVNFFRYDVQSKNDGTIERTKVDLGRVDLSEIEGNK